MVQKSFFYLSIVFFLSHQTTLCIEQPTCHPLTRADSIETLVKKAKELNTLYPTDYIYSLGQTPAYLVSTMQMMAQDKARFKLIPFSGRFCTISERKFVGNEPKYFVQTWTLDQSKKPNFELYQNVLKKLELQISDIIDRYTNNNIRTVILEFSVSYGGLASFLTALFAHQTITSEHIATLKSALVIHVLEDPKGLPVSHRKLEFSNKQYQVEIVIDKTKTNSLFTQLADCDQFQDRLVPFYSYLEWDTDPTTFKPSKQASQILDKISKYLNTHS